MIDIDFSLSGGVVTFNEFPIDQGQALENHINDLKEDMLQVEFPEGYILDVGWRPSFEIDGKFHIVLIKDLDWTSPMYSETAENVIKLKDKIIKALEVL